MSRAALLLSVAALLCALWPLWPRGQTLGAAFACLGIVPALAGLFLGWRSRSEALRDKKPLGIHTAALGLSVAATLFCAGWLFMLLFLVLRGRP